MRVDDNDISRLTPVMPLGRNIVGIHRESEQVNKTYELIRPAQCGASRGLDIEGWRRPGVPMHTWLALHICWRAMSLGVNTASVLVRWCWGTARGSQGTPQRLGIASAANWLNCRSCLRTCVCTRKRLLQLATAFALGVDGARVGYAIEATVFSIASSFARVDWTLR